MGNSTEHHDMHKTSKLARLSSCLHGLSGKWKSLQEANMCNFFSIVLMAVVAGFTMTLLVYFAFDPESSFGIIVDGFEFLYDVVYVDVVGTPDYSAIILVWIIIILIFMLWFLFVIFSFFLNTNSGPAIMNPPVITPGAIVLTGLSFLVTVIWVVALDSSLLWGLILNVAVVILMYSATATLAVHFAVFRPSLLDEGRTLEVVSIIVLGLNTAAMFTAWMTYLAALNLTYYLLDLASNEGGGDDQPAVGLMVFGTLAIIYFLLDLTSFEPYTRFVVSPYIVIAIATFYALDLNYDADFASLLLVAMLGMALVAMVARLALSLSAQIGFNRGQQVKPTKSGLHFLSYHGKAIDVGEKELLVSEDSQQEEKCIEKEFNIKFHY